MFRYNKLLKMIDSDDDVDDVDNLIDDENTTFDIQSKNGEYKTQGSLLDSIIQHPFMETISIDINTTTTKREKYNIIVYRLGTYGTNKVVEFYLSHEFLSVHLEIGDNISSNVIDALRHVAGVKRVLGQLEFDSNRYIFVQTRNNTDMSNWLNIWDIVCNKHYFGDKLSNIVVDFFTSHIELGTLIQNKRTCILPIVLYSYVDEHHLEYIRKNNSIQYCQREKDTLIRLNRYKLGDNIRTICFVEDTEFSNTYHDLLNRDYILIDQSNEQQNNDDTNVSNDNIKLIFKNETRIFSHIK